VAYVTKPRVCHPGIEPGYQRRSCLSDRWGQPAPS